MNEQWELKRKNSVLSIGERKINCSRKREKKMGVRVIMEIRFESNESLPEQKKSDGMLPHKNGWKEKSQ